MHLTDEIEEYILNNSTPQEALLFENYRQTHLKMKFPRMHSGYIQGKVLEMISFMINPQYILEIGTFTGFSAMCMAKGLQPNGKIITIDNDDEIETFTRSFISRCQQANQIEMIIGNAIDIIPTLTHTFDLVFVDGDKRQYPEYYAVIIDKVKSGGFILADNVLWSGKVVEENSKPDEYLKGILDFNTLVKEDSCVENIILPIRDGINIIRKM